MNNIVFMTWTGDNPLTENRKKCIEQFKKTSQANVILITPKNLHEWILPDHPLHPAYEYLNFSHRADYLRTYMMHFYGGGHSDIKKTTGSWLPAFKELRESDKWIIGYPEVGAWGVAGGVENDWKELVGNCAYICKPKTPLTQMWYDNLLSLMDSGLDALRKNGPANNPDEHNHNDKYPDSKYPFAWTEVGGRMFHPVCAKYKDRISQNLPISIFLDYR